MEPSLYFLADVVVNESYASQLCEIGQTITEDPRTKLNAFNKILGLSNRFRDRIAEKVQFNKQQFLSNPSIWWFTPGLSSHAEEVLKRFFESESDALNLQRWVWKHLKNARESDRNLVVRGSGPLLTKIFQKSDDTKDVQDKIPDNTNEENLITMSYIQAIAGWKEKKEEGAKVASLSRVTFGTYYGKPAVLKTFRPRQLALFLMECLFAKEIIDSTRNQYVKFFLYSEIAEITKELDYENEEKNTKWGKAAYATSRWWEWTTNLRVPDILKVESNSYMPYIIEERAEGTTLHTWAADATQTNGDKVFEEMKNLVLNLLRRLLDTGYMHSDLHPGNIMVGSNSQLTLIDFGAVSKFERNDLKKISEIIFDILGLLIRHDAIPDVLYHLLPDMVANAVKKGSSYLPGPNLEQVMRKIWNFCQIADEKFDKKRINEVQKNLEDTKVVKEHKLFEALSLVQSSFEEVSHCHFNSIARLFASFQALWRSFDTAAGRTSKRSSYGNTIVFLTSDLGNIIFVRQLNMLIVRLWTESIRIPNVPLVNISVDIFLVQTIWDLKQDLSVLRKSGELGWKGVILLGAIQIFLTKLRSLNMNEYLPNRSYWERIIMGFTWDIAVLAAKVAVVKKGTRKLSAAKRAEINYLVDSSLQTNVLKALYKAFSPF